MTRAFPPDPGCRKAPGTFHPQVDRNRCEGKGACVAICPKHVFALGRLPESARHGLSLRGRIKGFVHRWQQALLADPAACEACGLCIQVCPESAITLVATAAEPCASGSAPDRA